MLKKLGQYFFTKNIKYLSKINNRNFGILDRITEKRQKKLQEEQLNFFLDRQNFDFNDYKQYVQNQIDQQQGKIRNIFKQQDDENLEELLEEKKFLSVLVEEELQKPWSVCNSPKLQKEIALVCSVPHERVDRFIENFKQIYLIHYWLRHRKKFNKKIPKNSEEFQILYKYEPRQPYKFIVQQKRKLFEITQLRQQTEKRKQHYIKVEEAKRKKRFKYVWKKKKLNYK